MILTKEVEVYVNNKNIMYFRSNGLDVNYGHKSMIPVNLLPKYSKHRILVLCENCNSENELSMQKYSKNIERGGIYTCKGCNNITYKKSMIEKYGVDNSAKFETSVSKRKKTCLEKYGSEYTVTSKHCIEKSKNTIIERYGVHYMKLDEFKFKGTDKSKDTKIKNGFVISDENISEWEKYRRDVRKLTERNRVELFKIWDGYDYYDSEYIKDNFNFKHTHQMYPTLDHKISIIHGFKNGLKIEEISDISNLCITKKMNNSSKSFRTEEEYAIKNL